MLHLVLKDYLILFELLFDILLEIIVQRFSEILLILPAYICLLCQQIISVLVMQLYLFLQLKLWFHGGSCNTSLVYIYNTLRRDNVIVVVVERLLDRFKYILNLLNGLTKRHWNIIPLHVLNFLDKVVNRSERVIGPLVCARVKHCAHLFQSSIYRLNLLFVKF